MEALNDTLNIYSTDDCLQYVAISAGIWFIISHIFLVENIVLPFTPKYLKCILLEEAQEARERYERTGNQNDRAYLVQLRNRCAGLLNSIVSVILGLYCILLDQNLIKDKLFGVSNGWIISGSIICGYFVWDFIIILLSYNSLSKNWQWLLHAIICLSALISPFFAKIAPMSYYAALFLILEASSPLMSLRWLTLKAQNLMLQKSIENQHKNEYKQLEAISSWNSIAFAVMFLIIRLIWGPIYLYIPLMKLFFQHPAAKLFNFYRWWMYVISVPIYWILNLYWMIEIIKAGLELKKKTKSA